VGAISESVSAFCALGVLAFGVFSLWLDRGAKRDARIQHVEDFLEAKHNYRPLGR
jgi:hypothetical protein